jgi:peptidoglycan/xylan/chitin deacetylase (PgdA/CDA1 family)
MRPLSILPGVALSSVALAGVAHAAPAVAFLPGLRRRFLPALAGIGDAGHVALTFDDGPSARSTPLFLQLLRERGVRATFFLLGEQVARTPDVARAIVADGHEVAVHGWNHRCLLVKGPRRTLVELRTARDIIANTTGARPRWFRAPTVSSAPHRCSPHDRSGSRRCCGARGASTGPGVPPARRCAGEC